MILSTNEKLEKLVMSSLKSTNRRKIGGGRSSLSNSSEFQILNDGAIRYNHYLLDYCQTSVSALSGCTAGLLGLTGLNGFAFYFVCSICVSTAIFISLGNRFEKFFLEKQQIFTGPLWSGIQTYMLFWTFMYGMVHVY